MRRFLHRWPRLVLVSAVAGATGCGWHSRPYARDPLVRDKRPVLGEPERVADLCDSDRPCPPTPPSDRFAPQR